VSVPIPTLNFAWFVVGRSRHVLVGTPVFAFVLNASGGVYLGAEPVQVAAGSDL
jgi:hypothetical protein